MRTDHPTPDDVFAVVWRFNDAITDRDLRSLEELMSDDHRFIDSEGSRVEGKTACLEAWKQFFESFPGYRNYFDSVKATQSVVVIRGHSTCAVPELDGPALWRARVVDGRVAEWEVLLDTIENRRRLGIV